MTAELMCPEPVLEATVARIVRKDPSLFFNTDVYRCYFQQAWITDLIRNTDSRLMRLPDVKVCSAQFSTVRKDTGNAILGYVDLMLLNDFLIPLGTHVNASKKDYKVYQLNGNCEVNSEGNLSEFLIERLPDMVTLTRTLSPEEVEKYSDNPDELGSSHQLFWTDIVHTAVHNITDEFSDTGYERAVKFIFSRDELRNLLSSGLIQPGTYDFIFKDRAVDSPFPFELEITFKRNASPSLVQAYHRWKDTSGLTDIPNPFYK